MSDRVMDASGSNILVVDSLNRRVGISVLPTERFEVDGNVKVLGNLILANVLPIVYGGTGAATAATARDNLDVYSKSEVDALLAAKASSTHTHGGSTGSGGDPAHTHPIGAP